MTTINSILHRISRANPNPLPDEVLAGYLLHLDGRIAAEVTAAPTVCPTDRDAPLTLQPPYDLLYDRYLDSMIAYHLGDTAAYNHAAALFQSAWSDWRAHYRRTHRPDPVEVLV